MQARLDVVEGRVLVPEREADRVLLGDAAQDAQVGEHGRTRAVATRWRMGAVTGGTSGEAWAHATSAETTALREGHDVVEGLDVVEEACLWRRIRRPR